MFWDNTVYQSFPYYLTAQIIFKWNTMFLDDFPVELLFYSQLQSGNVWIHPPPPTLLETLPSGSQSFYLQQSFRQQLSW